MCISWNKFDLPGLAFGLFFCLSSDLLSFFGNFFIFKPAFFLAFQGSPLTNLIDTFLPDSGQTLLL